MNYTDEDNINIEELMSDELKSAVTDIRIELQNLYPDLTFNTLSPLSFDMVEKLCKKHNVIIYDEFKDYLNTPFAVAKYITLLVDAQELQKRVKADLDSYIDTTKIDFYILPGLKNEICFTKIIPENSEEKPQSLVVNYRFDTETEIIQYYLKTTPWGYDISKEMLVMLLNNDTSNAIVKDYELSTKVEKDKIIVTAGNINVIIKKE